MTCSILERENERIVKKAAELHQLTVVKQEKILPLQEKDGGFGAVLTKA